jgi:hypothetical protein
VLSYRLCLAECVTQSRNPFNNYHIGAVFTSPVVREEMEDAALWRNPRLFSMGVDGVGCYRFYCRVLIVLHEFCVIGPNQVGQDDLRGEPLGRGAYPNLDRCANLIGYRILKQRTKSGELTASSKIGRR